MRRIAVFTGTRAEYGLMFLIIDALNDSKEVDLKLYVGGSHLSEKFGNTISEIEKDGFEVAEKIHFLEDSDTSLGISKSIGNALEKVTKVLHRDKPDIILILGDRYETMAVAQAAMLKQIPIAHIHGGETTEGAIDEAIRHSITKMSHLHFTSTESHRSRVIQLGENPDRVFNVGAPGIDRIKELNFLELDELSKKLDFQLDGNPFFVVTFHPVTLSGNTSLDPLLNLLKALDSFQEYKLVITYPNADEGNEELINALRNYQIKQPDRILLRKSLGHINYLSALKHSTAVIGNSSSGIIEAPSFGIPTLNIGTRQKGRIAAESVLTCKDDLSSIKEYLKKIISKEFKEFSKNIKNPYGNGGSSVKIVNELISTPLDGILRKKFYDL